MTNPNFDTSKELYMLRSYNGALYNAGIRLAEFNASVKVNDKVMCELDCDSHTLKFYVNGVPQPAMITNLPDATLFPAV